MLFKQALYNMLEAEVLACNAGVCAQLSQQSMLLLQTSGAAELCYFIMTARLGCTRSGS